MCTRILPSTRPGEAEEWPPAGQVGGARGCALPLAARRSPSCLPPAGAPRSPLRRDKDGFECSSGAGFNRASPLRRLGSSRRAPRCPPSPPAPLRRRTSRCGARGYARPPRGRAACGLGFVSRGNFCLGARPRSGREGLRPLRRPLRAVRRGNIPHLTPRAKNAPERRTAAHRGISVSVGLVSELATRA